LAIEARRVMHAAPDRVFAHIGRIEHLPRYGAPLWMTAESVEKRRERTQKNAKAPGKPGELAKADRLAERKFHEIDVRAQTGIGAEPAAAAG